MNRDVCEHFNPADLPCAKCAMKTKFETLYHAAMRGRHAMSQELLAVTAQRDALLEALRGVMSVMPTLPKDARHIVGMEDRYKEALVSARAALKKAEGV